MARSTEGAGAKAWVQGIWLGALALLVAWALLAWTFLGRQRELESLAAQRARSARSAVLLGDISGALAQMESGNRAFFLSGRPQAREPFDAGRATLIRSYKLLTAHLRNDRASLGQLRTFKSTLDRWFEKSNPAIKDRRAAGQSVSDALLRRLAASETERTRILEEARVPLERLAGAAAARDRAQAAAQEAARAQLRGLLQSTAGLGALSIGALAFALAGQARKLNQSNESLRREAQSRRRAEHERQVLANHDEQILNSTTEGIVGLNLKGRITYANPAACAMLGWEAPELLGKPWHDIAQHSKADSTRLEKDASPVLATLRDAAPRRVADDVFWKRTGRSFPVEYAASPLWDIAPHDNDDNAKELSGATLTFRDITERKKSEIALLRLASVVESSKDAILSHLLDGTIVSCNASAVKLYGYAARELEGSGLPVLFPPSRVDEANLIIECMGRGERIEPYQTTLVAKNGAPVDVAITFYPVRDARGNLIGASSNARPVRKEPPGKLPSFEAMRVAKLSAAAATEAGVGEARSAAVMRRGEAVAR